MSDKRPVVVYGASGFSGRLVVEFLREDNVPFIAAGRDSARIEQVLDHVPGISTADYEVVQVGHTVSELTELFQGAKVVSSSVGPCIYYGDTVIEAALAAGCHYIDTGGEAPWVRSVREPWHERFAEAGLLVAPATAGHVPDAARAAVGRLPASDLVQGRPPDRERLRVRGHPGSRDHGERRRRAARVPGEDQAAAPRRTAQDPGRHRRLRAGRHAAPREPPAAAHRRRRLRARQSRVDPGRRARRRRVPADGPDPGVRRTPPRLREAALVYEKPRAVGFASPCTAFGHRELKAALEAYGMVRMKILG